MGRLFIKQGSLFDGKILMSESIAILEMQEHISRVRFPPLGVLPGWKSRAAKLEKAGIETADQFLETEPEAIAQAFSNITAETARQWQAALIEMFTSPASNS